MDGTGRSSRSGSVEHSGLLDALHADLRGSDFAMDSSRSNFSAEPDSPARMQARLRQQQQELLQSVEVGQQLLKKCALLEEQRDAAEARASELTERYQDELHDMRRMNEGLVNRISELVADKRGLQVQVEQDSEEKMELKGAFQEKERMLQFFEERNQNLIDLQRHTSDDARFGGALGSIPNTPRERHTKTHVTSAPSLLGSNVLPLASARLDTSRSESSFRSDYGLELERERNAALQKTVADLRKENRQLRVDVQKLSAKQQELQDEVAQRNAIIDDQQRSLDEERAHLARVRRQFYALQQKVTSGEVGPAPAPVIIQSKVPTKPAYPVEREPAVVDRSEQGCQTTPRDGGRPPLPPRKTADSDITDRSSRGSPEPIPSSPRAKMLTQYLQMLKEENAALEHERGLAVSVSSEPPQHPIALMEEQVLKRKAVKEKKAVRRKARGVQYGQEDERVADMEEELPKERADALCCFPTW
eukprot:Sspe_Gene.91737::Locus_63340_Transcript_1_1_Confidence_1.000_Length_1670::g.91737::m.91737